MTALIKNQISEANIPDRKIYLPDIFISNAVLIRNMSQFFHKHGYYVYNQNGAQNEYFQIPIFLKKGNYMIKIEGVKAPSAGIQTYYLDDIELESYDWYGSGDYTHTINVTIATAKRSIFKTICATKHADSTAYMFYVVQVSSEKTG